MEFSQLVNFINSLKDTSLIKIEGTSLRNAINPSNLYEGVSYLAGVYTTIKGYEFTMACWSVVSTDHLEILDILYDHTEYYQLFVKDPSGHYSVFKDLNQMEIIVDLIPVFGQ